MSLKCQDKKKSFNESKMPRQLTSWDQKINNNRNNLQVNAGFSSPTNKSFKSVRHLNHQEFHWLHLFTELNLT